MSLFVALVHHPVRDRGGEIITTSVTNLDVHDIARTARTYGVSGYFIVTPLPAQQELVERIVGHFRTGSGARRMPERSEALKLCRIAPDIASVRRHIELETGKAPSVLATAARGRALPVSYANAREILAEGRPCLLLFGTGHGLAPAVLAEADGVLAPIRPAADYNHLSVRAAVAITLDRLIGE